MSLAEGVDHLLRHRVRPASGRTSTSSYVQNQLSDNGLLLQNDLRGFGFGAPTGIDLPSEG